MTAQAHWHRCAGTPSTKRSGTTRAAWTPQRKAGSANRSTRRS
ncbi:hypothetical protein [Ornithinimicrobium kibberense]